jgi:multicomponent K+:H+ antiporter subunit G
MCGPQAEPGAEPGPVGVPAPPSGRAEWATHDAPHFGTPGDFEGD